MSSIFIQIPSYRDFEINKTIASAINNASGENQLHFGIHQCLLFDSEIIIDKNYPDWININTIDSIAPENIGLQMSRSIANSFYSNEDYYFQIDAHMRFFPNWDLKAIQMMKYYIESGIPNPLITAYPPAYYYIDDIGTEKSDKYSPTRILFIQNPDQFKETLIPLNTAYSITENCVYTFSVSGGCIFTLGSFAKIKPNPKITFWVKSHLLPQGHLLTVLILLFQQKDSYLIYTYQVSHLAKQEGIMFGVIFH